MEACSKFRTQYHISSHHYHPQLVQQQLEHQQQLYFDLLWPSNSNNNATVVHPWLSQKQRPQLDQQSPRKIRNSQQRSSREVEQLQLEQLQQREYLTQQQQQPRQQQQQQQQQVGSFPTCGCGGPQYAIMYTTNNQLDFMRRQQLCGLASSYQSYNTAYPHPNISKGSGASYPSYSQSPDSSIKEISHSGTEMTHTEPLTGGQAKGRLSDNKNAATLLIPIEQTCKPPEIPPFKGGTFCQYRKYKESIAKPVEEVNKYRVFPSAKESLKPPPPKQTSVPVPPKHPNKINKSANKAQAKKVEDVPEIPDTRSKKPTTTAPNYTTKPVKNSQGVAKPISISKQQQKQQQQGEQQKQQQQKQEAKLEETKNFHDKALDRENKPGSRKSTDKDADLKSDGSQVKTKKYSDQSGNVGTTQASTDKKLKTSPESATKDVRKKMNADKRQKTETDHERVKQSNSTATDHHTPLSITGKYKEMISITEGKKPERRNFRKDDSVLSTNAKSAKTSNGTTNRMPNVKSSEIPIIVIKGSAESKTKTAEDDDEKKKNKVYEMTTGPFMDLPVRRVSRSSNYDK